MQEELPIINLQMALTSITPVAIIIEMPQE
jgi:hypothetical protein